MADLPIQPPIAIEDEKERPAPYVNPLGFTISPNSNDPAAVPVETAPMAPFPGRPVDINPSATEITPSGDSGISAAPATPPTLPDESSPFRPQYGTTSKTSVTRDQYNPKDVKALDEAVDSHLKAFKAERDLEAAEATAKAGEAQIRSNEYQKAIAEEQKQEALRQEALNAKQAEIDRSVDEYAKMKLDPSRMWNSMSTGNSILAGLAMALGAIGGGATGGPNLALQVMDKAIDRDIDAQKVNMDKAKDNINMKRTLYSDLRQRFNDDQLARHALREIAFSKIAADAEARALGAQNPIIKANAETMMKEAQAKVAAEKMARNKRVVQTETVTAPIPKNLSKPDRIFEKDELKTLQGSANLVKAFTDLDKAYDEVQKSGLSTNAVVNKFNEVKSTLGFEVDPKWVEAAQAGNLAAKAYLFVMSGQGVTDKELQRAMETILPSLSQDPAVAKTRIREFARKELRTYDDNLKSYVSNFRGGIGGDDALAAGMKMRPVLPWLVREAHEKDKKGKGNK